MKPILLNFPVPIITPRLILRPPQIGDGRMLNEAVLESFDVLNKFMPWAKEKPSVNDSEEYVRQAAANWILKKNDEPYLPLFIIDKKTNAFIGATGFHHYDWEVPSVEIGYWIRSSCSGQGFMTEAVNAQTQFAFKELKMKRLTITCEIDNIQSKKIPERLGYQLESTIKSNRVNSEGKISDTLVFTRFGLDGLSDLTIVLDYNNDVKNNIVK
jgi:ribosomal-protein-serine acetyltransferase